MAGVPCAGAAPATCPAPLSFKGPRRQQQRIILATKTQGVRLFTIPRGTYRYPKTLNAETNPKHVCIDGMNAKRVFGSCHALGNRLQCRVGPLGKVPAGCDRFVWPRCRGGDSFTQKGPEMNGRRGKTSQTLTLA